MSNPSLKEQLQALSTALPDSPKSAKPKHAISSTRSPSKSQTPGWLEYVKYGVELLKAHYPDCFKENAEIKPLKIGIKQDLVKALSSREDIVIADKACMVASLSYYVNAMSYHKQVVVHVTRVDLEGCPAGTVTEQEALYSFSACKVKKQRHMLRHQQVQGD